MHRPYRHTFAGVCLLLTGCSGGVAPELPAAGSLQLPSLPALTGSNVVGTPTELYTRIARGAVTCWFGASGPLKGRHIYHADAEPESKGGAAEITIFVKDTSAGPNPKALKAFQIAIKPTGGTPELGVENFKIEEPLAARLRADVTRWAAAEEGCGQGPVTQGWDARQPSKPADKPKRAAKK